MKILNLYACLGGNRYKWGNDHEITAVELDPELAMLYKSRFPADKVIIADAHQYLLEHYNEFDFIWSSPPCPSHSNAAYTSRQSEKTNHNPIYPDMVLYQEIIFLQYYFKGKFVVENVIPYYTPLIAGKKRGRHLYWCNFNLPNILTTRNGIKMAGINEVDQWCKFHEYNFRQYKGLQRIDKIARNLVDFEAGKTILDTAVGIFKNKTNQTTLF